MTAGGLIFLGICLVIASLIIISVRIYLVRPEFIIVLMKYGIIAIFWMVFSASAVMIGFRISDRHTDTYTRGYKSVNDIWGGHVTQNPPSLTYSNIATEEYENQKTGEMQKRSVRKSLDIGFYSHDLKINIVPNIRIKGLLKFPGYLLEFSGKYKMKNTLTQREYLSFHFQLPANAGNITEIGVNFNGKPYTGDTNLADGITISKDMEPDEENEVEINYKAQGTGAFSYSLGDTQKEIKSLNAVLTTSFSNFNIPERAMVPTNQSSDSKASIIQWNGKNLITGQNISMDFKIEDYGAIASKLFYYSPLSLFLFLVSIVIFSMAKNKPLHPMNYLFIIVGFFIFYLFGSYMISYVPVIYGILLALVLSTGLILYYIFLIKKGKELLQLASITAFIFQWIFSIAFFFPEHTGFLITIASIASFIGLMRLTADTDWESALKLKGEIRLEQ